MASRLWRVLLSTWVAASACTGAALISSDRASSLVLQPSDVPPGLARFDWGPEEPAGRASRTRRLPGLVAGWVARYRNVEPSDTEGPLVVESRVEVFAEEDEAGARLDPLISSTAPRGRSVAGPKIGERTTLRTFTQRATPLDVRYFVIVWRHANTIASITVQGFDGRVHVGDAISLAQTQQRRMARASV